VTDDTVEAASPDCRSRSVPRADGSHATDGHPPGNAESQPDARALADDDDIDDPLKVLRDELDALQQQLDVLAAEVRARASAAAILTLEPTADPAASPLGVRGGRAWPTMSAEQAEKTWTGLAAFVDWLTDRYQLHDTLPGCWYRHGAFVEELYALHLSWIGAYQHLQAHPNDPLTWQTNLHSTLGRLREWDTLGCIAGRHRDTTPGANPSVEDTARAARDAYISADIHRRRRQPDTGDGTATTTNDTPPSEETGAGSGEWDG
jgi:hypothetical protein